MEALKNKSFTCPDKLCSFVNDKQVAVISIVAGDFAYTLFYKDK